MILRWSTKFEYILKGGVPLVPDLIVLAICVPQTAASATEQPSEMPSAHPRFTYAKNVSTGATIVIPGVTLKNRHKDMRSVEESNCKVRTLLRRWRKRASEAMPQLKYMKTRYCYYFM